MDFKTFKLTVENHVGHLELTRPDAYNSMNRDFWLEFPQAIGNLDETGEARVLVISSQGKHFSAGMDLEVFQSPDASLFQGEAGRRAEAMRRLVLQLQACFNVLESIRVPVITAIQGGCIGGALDMVCASDMRFCTEDAFFVVKETELGMTADLGTLQRLPQLIAPGLARELAYTARRFSAHEARDAGLVNRMFDSQEAMLNGVMEVATQISGRSPLAVSGCKRMFNYARDHSMTDSLDYMATWQAGMFQPTDMMLSMAARASGQAAEFEPLRAVTPPLQRAESSS